MVLDLKSEAGSAAIHAMLAKCDVFLSNYRYLESATAACFQSVRLFCFELWFACKMRCIRQRYKSLKGLGLDSEELLAKYPHLIICPMTGWGIEGPDADKNVEASEAGLGRSLQPLWMGVWSFFMYERVTRWRWLHLPKLAHYGSYRKCGRIRHKRFFLEWWSWGLKLLIGAFTFE